MKPALVSLLLLHAALALVVALSPGTNPIFASPVVLFSGGAAHWGWAALFALSAAALGAACGGVARRRAALVLATGVCGAWTLGVALYVLAGHMGTIGVVAWAWITAVHLLIARGLAAVEDAEAARATLAEAIRALMSDDEDAAR